MKATQAEIFDELEALSAHYVRVIRSPDQQERFYRDYLEDLGSYSLGAVKAGCKAWRHSDASKFPTPGQLLRFVRANERDESRPAASLDPWRELSDAEYEKLSLNDKIRHRTILATQCRERAGPMWAGKGDAAGPAERSPERQAWITRADNHYAEVNRLKAMLKRMDASA